MERIPPEQLAALARDNQGPKVVGIVIAFTVLALVCVLLRFLARIRFTRLVGWEDYFIVLSMVQPQVVHYHHSLLIQTTGLLDRHCGLPTQASRGGCR
jgi:hypothetical protein